MKISKIAEAVGQRFGRLVVTGPAEPGRGREPRVSAIMGIITNANYGFRFAEAEALLRTGWTP